MPVPSETPIKLKLRVPPPPSVHPSVRGSARKLLRPALNIMHLRSSDVFSMPKHRPTRPPLNQTKLLQYKQAKTAEQRIPKPHILSPSPLLFLGAEWYGSPSKTPYFTNTRHGKARRDQHTKATSRQNTRQHAEGASGLHTKRKRNNILPPRTRTSAQTCFSFRPAFSISSLLFIIGGGPSRPCLCATAVVQQYCTVV